MFLKNYQIKVVGELKGFFQTAREELDFYNSLPPERKQRYNWVNSSFNALHKRHNDDCVNGFGNYYPRVCIKVPTGGGKTLLAVEAIMEYKIRPDFVAAKKKGRDEFELLYIIESKGQHLSGNADTQYIYYE